MRQVGVACIGCVLFGYHLGVVNAPLDAISATLGFAGDAVRQGQVVSIGLAGAFLGSLGGGPLADGVGRKGSFAYTATTCAVGAALCASAQSFSALLLGRLICGLGIGAALCCVSLFIPEVAPPSQRGFLSSLNQLFTCGGILLSIVAGLPLARAGPAYWRKMFAVAILPCIAQLGALLWVPESPRWLAKAGRKAEAQEAATRLWGPGAAVPAVEASEAVGGSWAQLVSPRYRKLVAISSLLFVFQQFAGINAVVFFSTKVSIYAHAVPRRPTPSHAVPMQRTRSAAHMNMNMNMRMNCTCSASAAHVQCTCSAHGTRHARLLLDQAPTPLTKPPP